MCSDCVKCTLYAMMVDGKRSFYNLFKHLFLLFLLFVHLHISSTTISCCIYIKLGQRFRHVIFSFNGGARAHANEGVSRFSFAGALFVVDEYSMEKNLSSFCVSFLSLFKKFGLWNFKFECYQMEPGKQNHGNSQRSFLKHPSSFVAQSTIYIYKFRMK